MKSAIGKLGKGISSLGFSCTLLMLLALLTWLGTLEQVHSGLHDVQKKYFESFFLIHEGAVPVPLPGANLVMCLLSVNLIAGGIVRLRKDWTRAGILVTHVGIALLLLSGFVKLYFSDDGHVTLYEGQQSDTFQSYYRWEIVISEDLGNGRIKEHIVPQEDFLDATRGKTVTITSPEIPFDVEVSHFAPNCRPLSKGPMFDVDVPVVDGMFLDERPKDPTAERNLAGAYVTLKGESGEMRQGIIWGVDTYPYSVRVGGRIWGIDLRHEQYALPFTIALDKFTKEDHPRLSMARWFSSDVRVIENSIERPITISMNEPLRDRGVVVYQASWGPSNAQPGDDLFSTLSVVRNPADQYPLYACIVIAAGLLTHFSRKLAGYIRKEART